MTSSDSSPEIPHLEIDLKSLPAIKAYLDSILKCDDRTLKLRLAEIDDEKWTVAQWNTAGIAARTMLLNHAAYGAVLGVIQKHGGY